MNNKTTHTNQLIIQKGNFEEAEEYDVTYYASLTWKQSVSIVEEMRKSIWGKEYVTKNGVERIIKKAHLKDDRDEFEC
jgi:hypothetical protein